MNCPQFSPRFVVAALLAVAGVAPVLSAQNAKPIIVEEIVGPAYVPGTAYTLSEKGMRFAATHPKGDKWAVTIDGKEVGEFDQVLPVVPTFDTSYDPAGYIREQSVSSQGPVAFSRDGKHYSYAARAGSEILVILDGKEIFRAPHSLSAPPVSHLQFTPDGKHVYFYNQTADTMRSFRLMMDGKPVTPAVDDMPQPFFSEDGTRWLLSAGKAKQPTERILIIDGKDAGYSGQRVRFAPDGKHVVCTAGEEPAMKLLVDGKPLLTAPFIERFKVSATGDIAAIVRPRSTTADVFKQTLYLNGKLVPNSEGVADIVFSPDGKHWAAWFQRDMATAKWVVQDGKKHKEYAMIDRLTFSPDSSTLAYIAGTRTKQFMVTNGQEDEGNDMVLSRPKFAQTGNKFVYAAGQQPLALKIYHNGKPSPVHRNVWGMALSPDGERYAYFAGVDATTTEFIVDGEVVGRDGGFGGRVFFSPDSKHVAAATRGPDGGTVYADHVYLPARRAPGSAAEFTPDSQHLIVVGGQLIEKPEVGVRYFLDGDLVAQFSSRSMPFVNSPKMKRDMATAAVVPFGQSWVEPDPEAKPWEYMPDGTIVFIGAVPDPKGSGAMKRVTVTPAPGTNVASWFTTVKASEAQALADAEAAKAKAEADKLAAAEQRKAEAGAAAAKRKAAHDAAIAAKAKAREEALAARKKAAEEAAAKRAKK